MNLSLMSFQMMRVISSPSSSTMGFLTLIFLKSAILRRWLIDTSTGLEVKDDGDDSDDSDDDDDGRTIVDVNARELLEMMLRVAVKGRIEADIGGQAILRWQKRPETSECREHENCLDLGCCVSLEFTTCTCPAFDRHHPKIIPTSSVRRKHEPISCIVPFAG